VCVQEVSQYHQHAYTVTSYSGVGPFVTDSNEERMVKDACYHIKTRLSVSDSWIFIKPDRKMGEYRNGQCIEDDK
jgi:hypothetical protein